MCAAPPAFCTRLRDRFEDRLNADRGNVSQLPAVVLDSDVSNIHTLLDSVSPWMLAHQLYASKDRLTRILEIADADDDSIRGRMALLVRNIETLLEVMEDELNFLFTCPTKTQDAIGIRLICFRCRRNRSRRCARDGPSYKHRKNSQATSVYNRAFCGAHNHRKDPYVGCTVLYLL
jgi:hypothetical protein